MLQLLVDAAFDIRTWLTMLTLLRYDCIMCAFMRAYMHACIRAFMHEACTHVHMRMYEKACVCMYVFTVAWVYLYAAPRCYGSSSSRVELCRSCHLAPPSSDLASSALLRLNASTPLWISR